MSRMIRTGQEMEATLERIRHFQAQVAQLRKVETNPVNYRLSGIGIPRGDRPNAVEVREYLALHPTEQVVAGAARPG